MTPKKGNKNSCHFEVMQAICMQYDHKDNVNDTKSVDRDGEGPNIVVNSNAVGMVIMTVALFNKSIFTTEDKRSSRLILSKRRSQLSLITAEKERMSLVQNNPTFLSSKVAQVKDPPLLLN